MKHILSSLAVAFCIVSVRAQAPQGPFPPEQWPASTDPDKIIHYFSVDDALGAPNAASLPSLIIRNGGDQITAPITIGGFNALKATANFFNTADTEFPEWADDEEIDILMQVYGDAALLNAEGEPRNFNFLIGTLPELAAPSGGQIPVEAKNRKWNWVLFRIPNSIRDSDGSRRVGSIPANAQGDVSAGGVNGGTIRMEGVPNLIVRAVAFGEKGAFGEPEQVNLFASGDDCPAEPETNLAFIDLASEQSDHMEVLNDKDQTVTIDTDIGPDGDKRRAVRPNGSYMNFGVSDDYLGAACNDPHTVKICVTYYDDPALAGMAFGPEAFATDNQGSIGFVAPELRQVLAGTGTWQQRSWVLPAVSLAGVNTAPLTAGPRLFFEGDAPVYISRFDLGIIRTGSHPLAGQDPLSGCFEDPELCNGTYGNFAEMDLATGVMDGLAPGTSGGDQEMIVEEAGPENDRRMAIRPAVDDGNPQFAHKFLNLAITDEKLGPSSQPGAQLAICMTYYDDPALAGATFRPEVYQSDASGTVNLAFAPASIAVTLQGSGEWRNAYFELSKVKFLGVNQGPQAAARFAVSDKVFFSRVAYAVIRPCGPEAGVNALEECKPVVIQAVRMSDGMVRISWPVSATGYKLQENDDVAGPNWVDAAVTPVVVANENVVTVSASGTKFFRLSKAGQ